MTEHPTQRAEAAAAALGDPPAYSTYPCKTCGHIHNPNHPDPQVAACMRKQPPDVARRGAAKARAAIQPPRGAT